MAELRDLDGNIFGVPTAFNSQNSRIRGSPLLCKLVVSKSSNQSENDQ